MIQITETVKHLLIINVILFVGRFFVPALNDLLALHSFYDNRFQWWQLVTHIFMHGGIFHILFNMFALVSFGSVMEQFWGSKKFLFFYFSCGVAGALVQGGVNFFEVTQVITSMQELGLNVNQIRSVLNVQFLSGNYYDGSLFEEGMRQVLGTDYYKIQQADINLLFSTAIDVQTPMVGASGAIYGLMVAFAFLFPEARLAMLFLPVPIAAKYFVPGIVAIDLYLALKGSSLFGFGNIAHFAHLGGAAMGFLIMWYWKRTQFNKNRWN
ncbi:rhomboid family intramembrane serine protease [Flavobacterium sp.]|uniref:rhomboid family intramembrane serine protease n=1 Tax=Flavobacterium sp. TaxID=239 RepID=UPI003B99823E